MSQLDPNAAQLLQDEYARHVPPKPPLAVSGRYHIEPPSQELTEALKDSAENYGIPASAIDWATFIPALITAISTGSWLTLIPMIVKLVTDYGPQVWTFIQQIIQLFHKNPSPAPSTGPTITPQ